MKSYYIGPNGKQYERKFATKLKSGRAPVKIPKTRVCKDCKIRKKIDQFYKQKPPRVPQFKPDYRCECKKCQQKKSREALLRRTTIIERWAYQQFYQLDYKQAA